MQVGILGEIWNTVFMLLTLYYCIYPMLNEISYQWADKIYSSEYLLLRGFILIFIYSIIGIIIEAPFGLYFTFVLEERWGYNKTTMKTWIEDTIKTLLLNSVFITLMLG